jgi:hypothetical protein
VSILNGADEVIGIPVCKRLGQISGCAKSSVKRKCPVEISEAMAISTSEIGKMQ